MSEVVSAVGIAFVIVGILLLIFSIELRRMWKVDRGFLGFLTLFAVPMGFVLVLTILKVRHGTPASQRCTAFCGSRPYMQCTADFVRCGEEVE
jgi:uncharacterized membrane protein